MIETYPAEEADMLDFRDYIANRSYLYHSDPAKPASMVRMTYREENTAVESSALTVWVECDGERHRLTVDGHGCVRMLDHFVSKDDSEEVLVALGGQRLPCHVHAICLANLWDMHRDLRRANSTGQKYLDAYTTPILSATRVINSEGGDS